MSKTSSTSSRIAPFKGRGLPLDDGDLIRGLQQKDPHAANVFFDNYGNLINGLVRKLLGPDSEHNDVVHQALVQILTSVHKVQHPSKFQSWIVAVTANTVRAEIRRRKTRSIIRFVGIGPSDLPGNASAETLTVVGRFYAALDTIRANDRIALILRVAEGYKLTEVASLCNCSLTTTKRRIARARKAILAIAKEDRILSSYVEDYCEEQ